MSYSNSPANIVILIPKWALHLNSCLPGMHSCWLGSSCQLQVQARRNGYSAYAWCGHVLELSANTGSCHQANSHHLLCCLQGQYVMFCALLPYMDPVLFQCALNSNAESQTVDGAEKTAFAW